MAGKISGTFDFGETIATPPGVISYPNVFEARTSDFNDRASFSCTVLVPKNGADLSTLISEMMKPIHRQFGTRITRPSDFGPQHCPIRDGDMKDDGDPANGHWLVTAKSGERNKPYVLDRNNRPIPKERQDEIYGGMLGYMWVQPMTYDMGGGIRGVKLQLVGVTKLSDGERFGGGERFNPMTAKAPYTDVPDYLKSRVSAASPVSPFNGGGGATTPFTQTDADALMAKHLHASKMGDEIPF